MKTIFKLFTTVVLFVLLTVPSLSCSLGNADADASNSTRNATAYTTYYNSTCNNGASLYKSAKVNGVYAYGADPYSQISYSGPKISKTGMNTATSNYGLASMTQIFVNVYNQYELKCNICKDSSSGNRQGMVFS